MRGLGHKLASSWLVSGRSPRELLASAGRLVLWLLVALLLIRGAGALLAAAPDGREARAARGVHASGVWPDDGARSLAVEFATAYLTHTPHDSDDAVRRLGALASPELDGELAPRFGRDARAQIVRSATVEHALRVDAQHALITVAVMLMIDRRVSARSVTVPVARDDAGRLVVDDLPSIAAAPARARPEMRADEPLTGADRGQLADVLTRFVRAYLGGDSGALSYLIAPGARISAAAGRFELLSVVSLSTPGGASAGRGRRVVLVTVGARDVESRAVYMLRYRVGLVRRDRWYVAQLNEQGGAR